MKEDYREEMSKEKEKEKEKEKKYQRPKLTRYRKLKVFHVQGKPS